MVRLGPPQPIAIKMSQEPGGAPQINKIKKDNKNVTVVKRIDLAM